MPSFDAYRKMYGITPSTPNGKVTNGMIRKNQSDKIMDWTWDEDMQSKKIYLFDYFHDNERNLNRNMKPYDDPLKFEVDAKFMINSHNSESKDQVGYLIQFRPSFEWEEESKLSYYKEVLERKYGAEFPMGLYACIPDEKGRYRRWIVEQPADHLGHQFPTWFVIPCDYKYQWVTKFKKYECWGSSRVQNSYIVCASYWKQ